MKNIAINGFGRIGRLVFRQIFDLKMEKDLNIVAINDLTDAKTLAHLLKYDSAQGRFNGKVEAKDGNLIVNGKTIKIFAERDPQNLPWGELKIDVAVESTGFFTTKEGAEKHIKAGAKKVAISAPASGGIKTIVYSVNDGIMNKNDTIISGASCTTNCLAPIVNAIDKKFKITSGLMTTIHSYTGDQKLVDAPHSDLRRARAGAVNIIPTSTGAAAAVGLVLPHLDGKLDGMAMRVPTITGSVVDLTFEVESKNVTVQQINDSVKKMASASLEYVTDPIVSTDVIGSSAGSLFDADLTRVITDKNGKQMFKVIAWYDNETSYVSQFVRTLDKFSKL